MVCNVYYGELKESYDKIKSPYDVLKWMKEIQIGSSILSIGDKYFGKAFQCDWGSFIWKCSKKQLEIFQSKEKVNIPDLQDLSDDIQYGVVFIEVS